MTAAATVYPYSSVSTSYSVSLLVDPEINQKLINDGAWGRMGYATDITFGDRVSVMTTGISTPDDIPDAAAYQVGVGAVLSVGGFIAAWLSDSGVSTLAMAIGLLMAARGMANAEAAVDAAESTQSPQVP